jgi:hypothetical protein
MRQTAEGLLCLRVLDVSPEGSIFGVARLIRAMRYFEAHYLVCSPQAASQGSMNCSPRTRVVGVFASEKQRLLDRFSEASRYFESAFWYVAISAKRKRITLPVVEDPLDQLILNV